MKKGVMMMVAMAVVVISGLMATPALAEENSSGSSGRCGSITSSSTQNFSLPVDMVEILFGWQNPLYRLMKGIPFGAGQSLSFALDSWGMGGWKDGVTSGSIIAGSETGSGSILSGFMCTPEYCVEPPERIGVAGCPLCPTPPPWCCACGEPPGCKTLYWVEYHKYEGFSGGWCWCGAFLPCYCSAATRETIWEPWQEHAEVCAERIENKTITDLATFSQEEIDANCSTTCAEPGSCWGENPCDRCSPVGSGVQCCISATADFTYTSSAICAPYSYVECPPGHCG